MGQKRLSFHLITFGCQMNKSDSERMKAVLNDLGMEETIDEKNADLIIINTCSVRQTAEDRVFGLMTNFAKLRKNKPKLILGVTGCMPGRDTKGVFRKKLEMVDLYFKIDEITKLPEWLEALNPEIGLYRDRDYQYPLDYLKLEPIRKNNYQMFLPIQTGCNRFCTYCVVPFSRGLERNRPFQDIINEAKKFADQGGIELTLLGQTVNSYEFPKDDLPKLSKNNPYKTGFSALLYELNQISGIRRIFYTAPHPDDMNDECIDALTLPKLLNYLHLPVQSGSDKILKLMKRSYTRAEYLEVIKKIKKKVPDIALGTDIIVGFSEEEEKDFLDTYSLYQEVEFDISYTAKYSIRSGTFAAKRLKNTVSYADKKDRWERLQKLMETITLKKNQKYLNKKIEVLFERDENGFAYGWSREMKNFRVPSKENLAGQIREFEVKDAKTWILEGE